MKTWQALLLGAVLVIAGAGVFALMSEDDPVENFGDQVEEAGEEVGDEIDDAR